MNLHKLIITMFAILGLISSIISQNIPSYVPQNGLVAWYPFDGNANDESGNGNNGTVYNANLNSDRFNESNRAYSFNGSNSRIRINQSSSLDPSGWAGISLSFWVYQTSYLNGQPFNLRGSNQNDLAVYLNINAKPQASNFNSSLGSSIFVISPDSIYLNTWNHVVITQNYSSGKFIIYINGILKDSITRTLHPTPSPYINLGSRASSAGLSHFFNGMMDDIGFWNRKLTDNEIEGLYKACTGMPNASVLPLGSTTFCESDSVRLTSSIIGNYNYKWWRNNVELKGENSIFFTAKQEGSYSLSIDSFGCVSKSPSVIVKVNKLPIVQNFMPPFIHVEQTVFPLFGTPNGGSYSGLGVNGAFFNAKLAGLGRKNIVYTYTDTNLCRNTAQASTIVYDTTICSITVTDTLIINASFLSLNNQHVYTTIKIYPNPAQTHVFIDYENINLMQGFHLSILNTSGKEVHKEQIINNQSIIDLSKWSGKGLYIVNLYDNQNKLLESRKIVLN